MPSKQAYALQGGNELSYTGKISSLLLSFLVFEEDGVADTKYVGQGHPISHFSDTKTHSHFVENIYMWQFMTPQFSTAKRIHT